MKKLQTAKAANIYVSVTYTVRIHHYIFIIDFLQKSSDRSICISISPIRGANKSKNLNDKWGSNVESG